MDIEMEKSEPENMSEEELPAKENEKKQQKGINDGQEPIKMQQSLGISTSSSWVNKIVQTLSKGPQNRNHKETKMLLDYAKDSKGLGDIMEIISGNFIKSLINNKNKELIHFNQGTVLAKEGERITHFYFLIYGKLQKTIDEKPVLDLQQTFQNLGLSASQQVKQLIRLKKKGEVLDKSVKSQTKKYFKITQKQFAGLQFVEQSYFCGVKDRGIGTKYNSTVAAKEDSWVLVIPQTDFLVSLHTVMEEKVKKFMQKIRDIPCFKNLETQKIETFILSLAERKKTRGNEIFQQNQPSQFIYFLTEGEVKLTKISNLFMENPNNLSINRLKLCDIESSQTLQMRQRPRYEIQQNQIKRKQTILPYADFSSMYNFHPMKKNIEICRMQAFCLFGEEEHIEGKPRDTTALCNSISATYYQISMKRIQQIFGPKAMPGFLNGLKQAAKQKVLKRQQNYANAIHIENQANMKYFYYDGEKQAETSRKFRINKVNKVIEKEKNTILQQQKSPRNDMILNRKKETLPIVKKEAEMNPFYTSFNFNKLKPGTTAMGASRLKKLEQSNKKKVPKNDEHQLSKSIELPATHSQFSPSPQQSKLTINKIGLMDKGKASQYNSVSKKQKTSNKNIHKNYQTLNPQEKTLVKDYKFDDDDDDAGDEYLSNNVKPAKEELRIMNITHTWKLIKKKVDTQSIKSQKISPKKFTIDVRDPLIANQFLLDLQKEKKRIQRKIRKEKITLVPRADTEKKARRSLKFS